MLNVEGTKAAYNLYNKLGYTFVDGEMSFIGDIPQTSTYSSKSEISDFHKKLTYFDKDIAYFSIDFCEEQLLPHPLNIDGKMTRILKISPLSSSEKFDKSDKFLECLQNFLHFHRFCKFNINELTQNEPYLLSYFNCKSSHELLNIFCSFNFINLQNQEIHISESTSVMGKNLNKTKTLSNIKEIIH